jgi:DNA-binding FrmR family transcriptional regulator
MYRSKNEKDSIIHRLRIARGHLEKVITMVEQGDYCIDILHQSQAIQKALKETDHVILEYHLKTCTVNALKEGRHDDAVEEILQVVKRS